MTQRQPTAEATHAIWFRNDLRIADNTALYHGARAAKQAGQPGIRAVFVYTPDQWQAHDMAPARLALLRAALGDLSHNLAKRNIALTILPANTFADGNQALLRWCHEHQITILHSNREVEINEIQRDNTFTEAAISYGIEHQTYDDVCVLAPGSVLTQQDKPFTVFTPFKKRWLTLMQQRDLGLWPKPRKQARMLGKPSPLPSAPKHLPPLNTTHWPATESAVIKRLNAFASSAVNEYDQQRDFPAEPGTSQLSPYLAQGLISPRQCVHQVMKKQHLNFHSLSGGSAIWISEIVWREFYKHLLVAFPRLCRHRAFKLNTEKLVWSDDKDAFTRWCEGRTGFPLVDAAMRQLNQTHWMHNRLRMVTAMFLTKNLRIHWQQGERFFMQHLIDGDLAANNGGWQWSASTGCDAAPYFRIFNPYSQSERFDPAGEFIKRYVPELNDVDAKAIHQPHGKDATSRSLLCPDYPLPMVDAKSTRADAIAWFKAIM